MENNYILEFLFISFKVISVTQSLLLLKKKIIAKKCFYHFYLLQAVFLRRRSKYLINFVVQLRQFFLLSDHENLDLNEKKTNINLLIPEFDDCLDSASSISSKEILTNASINSTANSSPSKEDKKFVENNLSSNRNANTFSGSFSANTNFLTPINNKKNLQSPRSPRNPVTGEGINAPSSGRQKKMSYRRGIFFFSNLNYT